METLSVDLEATQEALVKHQNGEKEMSRLEQQHQTEVQIESLLLEFQIKVCRLKL